MYKYEYIGDTPQVLIDQHKEVEKKGDIVELDEPIDNVFFVLIPEVAAQEVVAETTQETKKKPKGDVINNG